MSAEFPFLPLYWHIFLILVLLFVSGYILIKDKSKYLLLLLSVNVFGNMPQFFGYYFYDEFFTLVLSVFYIWMHIRSSGYEDLRQIFSKKYTLLIVIFSVYAALQSVVGIMANEDIRIFRWFVFYLGLIPLYVSVLLSLRDSAINSNYVVLLIVFYLFVYLLIGVYSEFYYGNRFYSQNSLASGTSYGFFPILLLYIAMHLNIQQEGKRYCCIINNYLVVAFLIFLGMFFDSRLVQVSLIIWIFTLLPIRKYALWLKMISIYIATVIMYVGTQYTWFEPVTEQVGQVDYAQETPIELAAPIEPAVQETSVSQIEYTTHHIQPNLIADGLVTYVRHNILGSLLVFIENNSSDLTRSLQTEAVARIADGSNMARVLFGYGVYSHRVLMAEQMNVLLQSNLSYILASEKASKLAKSRSDAGKINAIYRTNAINAFVIDFGLFGLILLAGLYIVVFVTLVQREKQYIYTVIPMLGLSFVWLFFSNILDIYLLYLILIPYFINTIIKEK